MATSTGKAHYVTCGKEKIACNLDLQVVDKIFVLIVWQIIVKYLTQQLRQSQEEDDITKKDLQNWKEELTQLTEKFFCKNLDNHFTSRKNELF